MLLNMTDLLKVANEHSFAVPAFNIGTGMILNGVIETCEKLKAPVILAIHPWELEFNGDAFLQMVLERAHRTKLPVCIHLDHSEWGPITRAIRAGFTSVMIDASSKSFEDNIALTKQVVEYAHAHGVVVEAELGTLAGIEDEVVVESGKEAYTRPEEVEEFVTKTGCDSLAIAIGTSHGAYKFTAAQCTRNADGILVPPPLRFDVLEECMKRLPNFPIVLHGSSSVPQEFVKMVNQYGGNMPDAVGIPEEQLRKAAELAVCKINIDSDIRLAMTGNIRKYFAEHPDHFDPRQYLKPARQAVKDMVAHKIQNVLGSNGKA
jgi:fructose-bisphosphate aldolase class II